jgi:hypothetical protein
MHLDPEGNEVATFISGALGMFQTGWQQRAGTTFDWMTESEQAAWSKLEKNKEKCGLFPIPIRIDDGKH